MSDLDKTKRPAVCDAWDAFRAQPALLERLNKQEEELATLKTHNRVLADKFNQAIQQRDSWMENAGQQLQEKLCLEDRLEELQSRKWWQLLFS